MLPGVVVKGLPNIARAVISEIGKGDKGKQLLVEGVGLKEVMAIEGGFYPRDKTVSCH